MLAVPAWNRATRNAVVNGLYHRVHRGDRDVLRVTGVVALRARGDRRARYGLPSDTDLMYVDGPDWLSNEKVMAELARRTTAVLSMRKLVDSTRDSIGEQAQERGRLIAPDGEPIDVDGGVQAAARLPDCRTDLSLHELTAVIRLSRSSVGMSTYGAEDRHFIAAPFSCQTLSDR